MTWSGVKDFRRAGTPTLRPFPHPSIPNPLLNFLSGRTGFPACPKPRADTARPPVAMMDHKAAFMIASESMELSLSITPATIEDAREILNLQKLAYQSEAAIYQDYTIPPLVQTLSEIEAELQHQVFLKAVAAGRIIGSVRAYLQQETCYIGRLIAHPDYQNRGLGTALMKEIERCFPQARRYELFTGHRSERNLYLYEKLGYLRARSEKASEKLTMVFLEKKNQR